MKRRELRPCDGCGKGLMHDNCIVFYHARVAQFVGDLRAIERAMGMEMLMHGNVALAEFMGPDDDLARKIVEHDSMLCLECATTKTVAELIEKLNDSDPAQETDLLPPIIPDSPQ